MIDLIFEEVSVIGLVFCVNCVFNRVNVLGFEQILYDKTHLMSHFWSVRDLINWPEPARPTLRILPDQKPKQTSISQYALKLISCSMTRKRLTRSHTLL